MITMHARPRRTDRRTDRRTNVMAIARRFVLTNASRVKNGVKCTELQITFQKFLVGDAPNALVGVGPELPSCIYPKTLRVMDFPP